jgi:hypothetical protein
MTELEFKNAGTVKSLYSLALKEHDHDGFYEQIDEKVTSVEEASRLLTHKLGDDVIGDPTESEEGPTHRQYMHLIPNETRRVVGLPFGYRCQNCGGTEMLISFLDAGNAVLKTYYADLG